MARASDGIGTGAIPPKADSWVPGSEFWMLAVAGREVSTAEQAAHSAQPAISTASVALPHHFIGKKDSNDSQFTDNTAFSHGQRGDRHPRAAFATVKTQG
jgi:hypothetical protein